MKKTVLGILLACLPNIASADWQPRLLVQWPEVNSMSPAKRNFMLGCIVSAEIGNVNRQIRLDYCNDVYENSIIGR